MHASVEAQPQHPQHPYLLLVDDEKDFLEALAFRLEARGIPCLKASSGEDALPLLDKQELEIVLLDLNMPGMSGLDTLQFIKKHRPDIEVLLLTGESALAAAAKGMRRGAGDYLLKPVDMPTLLDSIAKAKVRVRTYKERMRASEAGRLLALGSLAHGVGHEINNPLQVIVQGAEWLCELIEDSKNGIELDRDEVEATAKKILGQARACARITAQLLDMAHRARSNTAEILLAELARNIVDREHARAKDLRTRIVLKLAANLPPLPYSQAEIEPLLAQLLENSLDAIEAAPHTPAEGHHITIAAWQAEQLVHLEVRDTGEGIAPEHAQRIFDPFFSTRAVGKGSGLGLTTCHSIVTALRGAMRHKSHTPQGTIMIVELPMISNPEKKTA
ncbi:MAG: response regulator [Desulfovibrionaceae bacterium]|nr:response regulator [Desulfovibrionaceae bacterium]